MANEVVEQNKEHVSENPEIVEIKDTEHVESSEVATNNENVVEIPVPPEEEEKASEETSSNEITEEMTPHEVNSGVEKIQKGENVLPHIVTPEDVVKKEGDGSDIQIDMKTIEFDKDGIPVLNSEDIARIKNSGFAVTDFEFEISEARNIIKECRTSLSIEEQNKTEEEDKKLLEELSNRKCETEEEKKSVEETIQAINDEIAHLPKYDKKAEFDITVRENNAIKHIATYQSLSRSNIHGMQQNGTLYALISASSNTAFLQAFTESARTSKKLSSISEDESLIKIKESKNSIEQKHQMYEYYNNAFEDLEKVDLEKLIAHTKDLEDSTKTYDEEVKKYVDREKIVKVGALIDKATDFLTPQDEAEKISTEIEDIKTSLVSVEENLPESVTKTREEESEYINQLELYCQSIKTIKHLYPIIQNEGVDPSLIQMDNAKEFPADYLPSITSIANAEEIKNQIKTLKDEYYEKWSSIDKEYVDLETQIEETVDKLAKPYKKYVRNYGLFASFLGYAFSNSEHRGYYGRPESALEFQHINTFAEKYYDVIRYIMYEDQPGYEFETTQHNVNSVSMNFSNIIRYFEDLYNDKIDIQWSAGFDPDSVLKNYYYDNKENLDKFIREWIETKNIFSYVLCHNIKFSGAYTKLISDIVAFFKENEKKFDNLNNNKKIKNKNKFRVITAFYSQFYVSYRDYIEKAEALNKAVEEKRKSDPNMTGKEFDEWYKANLIDQEHEATNKVINSFIHLILGCTVIYAFDEFAEYFETRNKNKSLKEDVVRYLFSEFILESNAFKSCPKDGNYADFIKTNNKHLAFKSIDFSMQRDVRVERARNETLAYIFGYVTESFRALITNICEDKEEEKEEKKDNTEKVKKNKKKSKNNNEALLKSYKEKHKKTQKEIGKFKSAISEYRNIIENAYASNSVATINIDNDVIEVSVHPSKDTKVIVRAERYDRDINNENVKKMFEEAIIDKSKEISVQKAYNASKCISNESLININEKWYYNQFTDGTFEKIETKNGKLTLSEKCRYIINKCLKNSYDEIITATKEIISKKGIDFTNKDIAIKSNCKFDIKYLKNISSNEILSKIPDNGNLNFFKSESWDIVTFELNYDIINKK